MITSREIDRREDTSWRMKRVVRYGTKSDENPAGYSHTKHNNKGFVVVNHRPRVFDSFNVNC